MNEEIKTQVILLIWNATKMVTLVINGHGTDSNSSFNFSLFYDKNTIIFDCTH